MHSPPIYDPAEAITGKATGAALVGGRLVKVQAAKTDGNPLAVAHCGASDGPVGAVAHDTAQDDVTPVYTHGHVLPLEAGGTVTAGSKVEVMAAGKVQNLASGTKVGVAFTAGGNGDAVLVQLQF